MEEIASALAICAIRTKWMETGDYKVVAKWTRKRFEYYLAGLEPDEEIKEQT